MNELLPKVLFVAGIGQLSVLVGASLVPFRLKWAKTFRALPCLQRQMYWVYGGFAVMSIIALGLITLVNPDELASGTFLARSFCLYATIFWGVRLWLVTVLDVKEHLTAWWLTAGYCLLNILFACFTVVFAWAAFSPLG
jgi:hypothetical protein